MRGAVLALALVAGHACAPARVAQAPIPLPDLARSPASVRTQIGSAYEQLQTRIAAPGAADSEIGQAYGEMGRLFMAAEYYEAAASCLVRARTLQPGDARWSYLLGHLSRLTNDPSSAVRWFSDTVQVRPHDVAALVWLGTTYLDLGRADDAAPLFERALAEQPRLVSARGGLGRAALARRDYAGAVEQLTTALEIDPRASILHYPLALAYRELGDMTRAEANMRARGTTDIGPPDPVMQDMAGLLESAPAYEFRGIRALERGQAAQAAGLFRRGLALEPRTASLHHRLGTSLILLGDEPAARRELAEAVSLAPDYGPAHYSLGVLAASHGRYAEAAEHFGAAVTHAPEYSEARLALAEMLAATGRARAALPHFDAVLDARPQDADAARGRALALASLGRHTEADHDRRW
jgi:tetratricopeptide (TPR) repeat protein